MLNSTNKTATKYVHGHISHHLDNETVHQCYSESWTGHRVFWNLAFSRRVCDFGEVSALDSTYCRRFLNLLLFYIAALFQESPGPKHTPWH